jgi:hypothetical protein
MQKWEYHTASLVPIIGGWSGKLKGWKLKAINDQDLPNWQKEEMFSSLIVFCNRMGQEGWEMISTGSAPNGFLLFFKRPYEQDI